MANKGIFRRTGAPLRLVRDTVKRMRESDVQILASSLAFGTVISLVPLLAVSLSVFHALGGFDSLMKQIEPFLMHNFVEASGAEASRYIRKAVKRIHSGALGIGGAVGLLIVSTKLFHEMETAVQRVWGLKSTRSIIKRLIVYWIVMFLGPLVLAVALGLIGSKDLGLLPLIPKGSLTVVFGFISFFAIYKLVPSCPVSYRAAGWSALIATIGISLAQSFYVEITRNILRYNKVYGSLASIPIFLLWILVLWWICLGGVALCATLEKKSKNEALSAEQKPD